MGASYFEHHVKITKRNDLKSVFRSLVEQDKFENGHSYSGGIGMKSYEGFTVVTPQPVTQAQAKKILAQFHEAYEWTMPKKGDLVKVDTWDKRSRRHLEFTGKVNRKQGDRFRIEKDRPSWARTQPAEFVLVPQYDVEVIKSYPRWIDDVQDKGGPAGVILVKGGRAIIFGYASS